jgi:hypothetical protein
MNQNPPSNASSSNLMWRPPYASENLKTPRFVKIKTYSTTNPYAKETQTHSQTQNNQPSTLVQDVHDFHDLQDFQHSKRENNSNKMHERDLTPQVGMNPFLQGNYLQDLETQNEFLKPMNSNILSSSK